MPPPRTAKFTGISDFAGVVPVRSAMPSQHRQHHHQHRRVIDECARHYGK